LSTMCQTEVEVAPRAAPGDEVGDARREHLARASATDLETKTYAQAMVADVDDVDEWRVAARMGWRHWLTVTVGGCASLAHGVGHSGCVTPGV